MQKEKGAHFLRTFERKTIRTYKEKTRKPEKIKGLSFLVLNFLILLVCSKITAQAVCRVRQARVADALATAIYPLAHRVDDFILTRTHNELVIAAKAAPAG